VFHLFAHVTACALRRPKGYPRVSKKTGPFPHRCPSHNKDLFCADFHLASSADQIAEMTRKIHPVCLARDRGLRAAGSCRQLRLRLHTCLIHVDVVARTDHSPPLRSTRARVSKAGCSAKGTAPTLPLAPRDSSTRRAFSLRYRPAASHALRLPDSAPRHAEARE